MDLETELRENIRAIYQEAERQAEPYWAELIRLDSLKPRPPVIIPYGESLVASLNRDALAHSLEIHKMLQDAEEQVATVGRRLLNQPPETPAPPPPSPPPGTSATDTAD